jgi:hypothetical protein
LGAVNRSESGFIATSLTTFGIAGMRKRVCARTALLIGASLWIHPAVFADDLCTVAGAEPSRRPASAPTITQVSKDDAWYARALTGIESPHPPSLGFLEDQGNWHTPFTEPGMPGRYDIRGWYQVSDSGQ